MGGPINREADHYLEQVNRLRDRYSSDNLDEHYRVIARRVADERIWATIATLVWCGGVIWAVREVGAWALIPAFGVLLIWSEWVAYLRDKDVSADRDLIVMHAEDLVRLRTVAEAYDRGLEVWAVSEPAYIGAPRQVDVAEGGQWDEFWKMVYNEALELARLSPKKRRAKIRAATIIAKPSLEAAVHLADLNDVKPAHWVASSLYRLKQRSS